MVKRAVKSSSSKLHAGQPSPQPSAGARESVRRSRTALLLAAIVVAAGIAAYANSFAGVFLHDDMPHIVWNAAIRDLSDLPRVLADGRRPLLNLTLAINYAFARTNEAGEPAPLGFHVVNLLIHVASALLLLGVIRRMLERAAEESNVSPIDQSPNRQITKSPNATILAGAIALLWVVHPLNTQAVTYLIQRGESQMALFFLAAIYCFIRGTDSRRRWIWWAIAIAAASLSMLTKAVAVVLPFVLLLFDFCFLRRSESSQPMRTQVAFHLLSFSTLLWLLVIGVAQGVLRTSAPGVATVGFAYKGVTPWEYLLTQSQVVLHYLRLSVWPTPLLLDYEWPVARTLADVWPAALLVVALLVATAWLITQRPRLGFVCAAFFIVLGPTSSFIPIEDVVAEHRMYLPLACVIALAVIALHALLRRARIETRAQRAVFWTIIGALTIALATRTIARNRDYHDAERMWRSVLAAEPDNPRAHLYIGLGFSMQASDAFAAGDAAAARGHLLMAREHYQAAVDARPDYGRAHFNLANTFAALNEPHRALAHYDLAAEHLVRRNEQYDALVLKGYVLMQLNRPGEALAAFEEALRRKPDGPAARDGAARARRLLGIPAIGG